jgi:osmotically-inducible protein OsmY
VNAVVPPEVSVAVSNGWITLSGRVDWHYQRHAARRRSATSGRPRRD